VTPSPLTKWSNIKETPWCGAGYIQQKETSKAMCQLDSIFLMAFSMAGTFFLKADHCSSVKLIPETQSQNSKTTFNY